MKTLPCLSIRQPWAWLCAHGHKDVENRTWQTAFRGRFLIHAGKTLSRDYFNEVIDALPDVFGDRLPLPTFDAMQLGGIVGEACIVDCVDHSDSQWFTGPHGFVLRDARPLPFVPVRGMQGFFNVPLSALLEAAAT